MAKSKLTSGELEVMNILWENGELKPAEIQEKFPREIKNPALRSHLSILCEKGHVARRLVGKAYHYKAKTQRKSALKHRLRELIDLYCNGSVQSLLLNLADDELLSEEDIEALKSIQKKNSGRGDE